MPARVALYARVSTAEQTTEPQLHALRQYASARGLAVIAEHVDEAISGTRERRPGLDALLAAARRRTIDAVVVVKLDRLGRSLAHLLAVLGELEALGVDFISLDDGIDSSTPAGRLFMQIRGAFAEYERALIVERTRAGLDSARRRGVKLGRPSALSPEQRKRLARLVSFGVPSRRIAELLGIGKGTVAREVARLRESTAAVA